MAQGKQPAMGWRAGLAAALKQHPALWLCSLGFACALMTWYPGRLGITLNFAFGEFGYHTDGIVIALLVAMVVVLALRPNFRLSGSRAFLITVGVVATACFFAQVFAGSWVATLSPVARALLELLYKLASVLLVLLWFEQARRFSPGSSCWSWAWAA